MADTLLQLTPGSLPADYCFTTPQQFYNDMFGLGRAVIPGSLSTFNYGNTTPSADNRDKPWIRTNADGSPDKVYVYFNGMWLSEHPLQATGATTVHIGRLMLWEGDPAAISGIDLPAPTADPITETTGPFWEEATEFRALMPIGVGTLPSGTAVPIGPFTAPYGNTNGEENHTLVFAEVPNCYANAVNYGPVAGADTGINHMLVDTPIYEGYVSPFQVNSIPGGGVHNNMPPNRGVYFIRRTGRKFYKAA